VHRRHRRVTGHSYIVYGPLANGATTLMYEGTPDHPDKDRFWRIVESYGVTICYTAPTAIPDVHEMGRGVSQAVCDLSSLRLLGSCRRADQPGGLGLVLEGHRRRPAVPSWTRGGRPETGHILITPLRPADGSQARIGDPCRFRASTPKSLDEKGKPAKAGYLVLRKPWPGCSAASGVTRTVS